MLTCQGKVRYWDWFGNRFLCRSGVCGAWKSHTWSSIDCLLAVIGVMGCQVLIPRDGSEAAKPLFWELLVVLQSTYVNLRVFGPPDVCKESFEAWLPSGAPFQGVSYAGWANWLEKLDCLAVRLIKWDEMRAQGPPHRPKSLGWLWPDMKWQLAAGDDTTVKNIVNEKSLKKIRRNYIATGDAVQIEYLSVFGGFHG